MKRQESSAGKSLGLSSSSKPCAPSNAASAAAAAAALLDTNGKDKRQHGRLRLRAGRGGRPAVAALVLVAASVYLIPLITVLLRPTAGPPSASHGAPPAGMAAVARRATAGSAAGLKGAAAPQQRQPAVPAAIPECKSAPWKENEDLRGKCPGDLKPVAGPKTVAECASSCCDSKECVTWQFRKGEAVR